MQPILQFFRELFARLFGPTPSFFRIMQVLSGIVATVSVALTQGGIAVPDWLLWLKSTTTLAVSITTAIVAQLPKPDASTLPKPPTA